MMGVYSYGYYVGESCCFFAAWSYYICFVGGRRAGVKIHSHLDCPLSDFLLVGGRVWG